MGEVYDQQLTFNGYYVFEKQSSKGDEIRVRDTRLRNFRNSESLHVEDNRINSLEDALSLSRMSMNQK